MNAHARAYLALIAAALFWAGNYVFGKVAVAGMSPFSIVFLRWTIALVPLVAIAKVVEHPDWMAVLHHWRFLLMQGLLGLFAYNFLLYAALRTSSAFAASLINAANPALIALTALIVLHERVGWRGGVGIALALLGVLVVLTHGDLAHLLTTPFSAADLLMLGVIVVWTAYTIAARKGPRLPPITQVAIQTALIVAGLTFVAPFAGVALPDSTPAWWSLAFIAIFPSCGSYVLWNRALSVVSSGRAGVFLNLITLFTALGALATGTPITIAQIAGGLIIIGGVLLTTLPVRSHRGADKANTSGTS